jgi:hypothetical protein
MTPILNSQINRGSFHHQKPNLKTSTAYRDYADNRDCKPIAGSEFSVP